MTKLQLERAMFVVGGQNTGKSNQLRSMYSDLRFHRNGAIPTGNEARKLPETVRLSNERSLYLRLTSPHEKGESQREFLRKTAARIERWRATRGSRWSFAGALQPRPARKMPGAADAVTAFINRFVPERTRVVLLNPAWHGSLLDEEWLRNETGQLWSLGVEVVCIDARSRKANGLFLADFFDFT